MLKKVIPLCLLALSVLSAPVQAADPLKDALKVQILPGWRAADDTIRKPIEESEARGVLEHIGNWSESVSDSWKVRANAQKRKLDDGNPFALAEVYKTLSLLQEADSCQCCRSSATGFIPNDAFQKSWQ